MEMSELYVSIIAITGYSSPILIGLGSWLGKIWSDRISNVEKDSLSHRLAEANAKFDVIKHDQVRNSDAIFDVYRSIWDELQLLRAAGDTLWESATRKSVKDFSEALKKAKLASYKGRLIFREEHYEKLQCAFASFENYQIGKERLVELRLGSNGQGPFDHMPHEDIQSKIRENGEHKARYEEILGLIVNDFRARLGLGV